MANRLAQETSPYLLQHRDNPVDWYPWGEEALARAREEDRPILLSVGYSACHWCHVMERESFEDAETAAYMNEHFVNVKVDREERPDVDAIYMEAVQAISGHGGWPMTVFLDPDGVPFYGGTYFPPDESRGMPSFRMVMEAVVDAFERQREEIRERAPRDARRGSARSARSSRRRARPSAALLEEAVRAPARRRRPPQRRLRRRPQVPARLGAGAAAGPRRDRGRSSGPSTRCWPAASTTSSAAASPATRSTPLWLVPHFEKMLYDNALLARAYLHGWQALGHERYRRVCEETLDWMLREMRGPEGGFYSALDADSEGEEGRFYVWTPDADPRGARATDADAGRSSYYGVSERGQLRGREHPPPRRRRRRRRARRPRPRRAQALLRGARASGSGRASTTSGSPPGTRWRSPPWPRPAPCSAARTTSTPPAPAPSSCSTELRDDDGHLLRTYKDGAPTSTPTSRTTPSCSRRC